LDSAELAYEPTNPIAVSEADWERVQIIIDLLDEDDDVDQVFTNAE
jgi:transcriptional/translational regulatory protein YebC/TACO1